LKQSKHRGFGHVREGDARGLPSCEEFDIVGTFGIFEHVPDGNGALFPLLLQCPGGYTGLPPGEPVTRPTVESVNLSALGREPFQGLLFTAG